MKLKKNNDKSPEDMKEVALWRYPFKKSIERKWRKNFSKPSDYLNCSSRDLNTTLVNEESSSKCSDSESTSECDHCNKEKDYTRDTVSEPDQLNRQLNILSFDSSEDETTIIEEENAFQSFEKLNHSCNAAHLSVFVNFTITHSISEYILFYLITDLYAKGCVRDMKKWVFEIYSSFLASFSPLKILSDVEHESLIKVIEMKLAQISIYDPTDSNHSSYDLGIYHLLHDIFQESRCEVQKVIEMQLVQFQNKRRAGLEAMYGASPSDLKAAKKNKTMRHKVIEKNLMPKLLRMLNDVEEIHENSTSRILVSALYTVTTRTFHVEFKESLPEFVSQSSHVINFEHPIKGHNLTSKTCFMPSYCDVCFKVLLGLAPQAYECPCGLKVHECCVEKITNSCTFLKDEGDVDFNDSANTSKLMDIVNKAIGNRYIDNYKRNKGDRPKSDPGLYNISKSDSSDDGTLDESIWSADVSIDSQISENDRKRKEVITELFETERRHVKVLKVLKNVFLEPLKRSKSISSDLLDLLFPASFFIIKDWHLSFEAMLKKEWHEQHGLLLEVGNCLSIFEDNYGKILKENVARFCTGQKRALEALREARSNSEVLQRALIKAESHKRCKRLQLKDLMLSILQRITKYPLLFERILKYSTGTEYDKIKVAYDSSKMILEYVNTAVRHSEELQSIQIKLDKTYLLKEAPAEFRNFNLSDHKLIYEGYAMLRKCPIILRVLLFEKFLVFLHKPDERYYLRSCESMKLPIVKLYKAIVRSNAIDSKSFFLISQTNNDSQMLDIITFSEVECQLWIEKISDAIEHVNDRMKLNRMPSNASSLGNGSILNLPIKKQSELATITQDLYTQAKVIEEWVNMVQKNLNVDCESKESDSISNTLVTFNCLISQLSIKVAENDHEREMYLKEKSMSRKSA